MYIVIDEPNTARFHMKADYELFSCQKPTMRIYEWSNFCITYGLFKDPSALLHDQYADIEVEVVKRPTGGGLLFHEHDLVFSFFFPRSHFLWEAPLHERVSWLNKELLQVLDPWLPEGISQEVGRSSSDFCLAQQSEIDLCWAGYKIGGSAQRRKREGILHQCSLFVSTPNWNRIESLVGTKICSSMQQISCSLESWGVVDKEKVKSAMVRHFAVWQ